MAQKALNHRTYSPPVWTVSTAKSSGCKSYNTGTLHPAYSPATVSGPHSRSAATASTRCVCPHRLRTSWRLGRRFSNTRRSTCMSGRFSGSWSCSGWFCSRICRSGWWGSMRIATVGSDTTFLNTLMFSHHSNHQEVADCQSATTTLFSSLCWTGSTYSLH